MSKVQEQPIDGLIATLWANQQGYVVRNEVGALVADVCDDMLHDWVAVCCYSTDSQPFKWLKIPTKVSPYEAVRRCLAEGDPFTKEP